MSSPLNFLILLVSFVFSLLLFFVSLASSSSLSTVAISEVGNQTLVCALLPSSSDGPYDLNCTALPSGESRSYPSLDGVLYSAVAAGSGFLCAVGSPLSNASYSSMRWWDFSQDPAPSKRVYGGAYLSALAASDSHVCGLVGDPGELSCWRWRKLSFPSGLNLTALSVGGDFLCGILGSGDLRCFGGNATGVVGNEPNGNFSLIAAGTRHACAISVSGELICWGAGAPEDIVGISFSDVASLALGDGRTCALRVNGTVICYGAGAEVPSSFASLEFMAIQARGRAFCGVLLDNYSLICWGADAFRRNPLVFRRVLPASCTSMASCQCGVLAGSGNTCSKGGVICLPCTSRRMPEIGSSNDGKGGGGRRRLLFIVLGAVGFGIGCVASACFLIFRATINRGRVHDAGRLSSHLPPATGVPSVVDARLTRLFSGSPGLTVEEFPLQLLLAATGGFSEKQKIGSGGFGSVYRATLPDGRVVAIKRATPPPVVTPTGSTSRMASHRRSERETAFISELQLLSRVNHKNLVRLHGFCREGAERILVYEFIARGTLAEHLHRPSSDESPLNSWPGRIKAALDAARGIDYLHSYAVPPIIHRDIKSSNILLDEDWTAKVSDFGLSLLNPKQRGEDDDAVEAGAAAGTVGYIDPEYYRLRHLTAKSDVYSFGVVLLEMLTGCRAVQRGDESGTPVNVVELAVPAIEGDEVHRVLDGKLPPPTPCEIEAVVFVGYLAADCVIPAARDRPAMSEVVAFLERALAACLKSGQGHGPIGPELSRSSTAGRSR
ncbi:Serine/threonine-protein kinase-like protein CCR4 [Apostasia shenzhenica]|uniref:Serine/threonine-protein kinase-like protein CCR4 n=1 Tax=Apostasia shenzhenica TaxID=1088818 RepID=A0A2I0AK96_9ASPA|nr:Serine/threonine-protein kinase-like protein CCR4 [Apostasia shenzhenica]